MHKFKNKKTGLVVEEKLMFYIKNLRSNPNFIEIKEGTSTDKQKKKEEVEKEPLH